MGLYDADVIQRMGKEAYDYILDRVKCGVISAQHMNDISSQLHPHVLGNHLRRVESGKACDEAEFRRILSDWFNQEMFDLDQQTVLKRLVSILTGPSVSLPSEGKRLDQILERIKAKEKALKIIVLLGESGAGKSSLGNCLLALDSATGFKESNKTESCTKKTSELSGFWVTNGNECGIIDTPGLNDSDNDDTEHIRGIVEFLRDRGLVNNFLIVRNGHHPRMNHSFKSMLSTFELTFGEDFWHHVIIVVSHTGYSNDPDEKVVVGRWKKRINDLFPKSAEAPLDTVVLDAKKTDHLRFRNDAERLWELVSATKSFECKELKAVKTELDEVKAMNKDLQQQLATLRDLTGMKVRQFQILMFKEVICCHFCVLYLNPGLCDSQLGFRSTWEDGFSFRKVITLIFSSDRSFYSVNVLL